MRFRHFYNKIILNFHNKINLLKSIWQLEVRFKTIIFSNYPMIGSTYSQVAHTVFEL